MPEKLRVLFIEDNEDHMILVQRLLKTEGFDFEWERVYCAKDLRTAFSKSKWDIVISDYAMPGFSGADALEIYNEFGLDIPFILVSGSVGEDIAIKMLKNGAHDYIMKDKINLIIPAIKRELHDYKTRDERNKLFNDLKIAQSVINNSPVIVWQRSIVDNVPKLFISENISQFGYEADDFVTGKMTYGDFVYPEDSDLVNEVHDNCLNGNDNAYDLEYRIICKDGSIRWINDKTTIYRNPDGSVSFTQGMLIDITPRKQADENALASERRFRELMENMELIAVILDVEGMIIFCNQYLLKLTGWKKEEILNQNWFDTFIPDDEKSRLKDSVFHRIFQSSSSLNGENDILTKSGVRKTIAWSNTVLRDSNGKVIGVSSIGQDISDRIKFEKDLQHNERLYKSLVETSPDAICMLNLDGTTIFSNQKKADMFGFDTADDLVGINAFGLIAPEFQYLVQEISEKLLTDGFIDAIEVKFTQKDGNTFWGELRSTLIKDDNNNPQYVINVVTNINERKKIQEAWQDSETRFRSAFENAPIGMELITLSGKIMKVNRAFCDLVGYSAAELENISFRDFTYQDDLNDNEEYVKNLTTGDCDYVNFEKRYVRKDKRIIWVNVCASLFRNSLGDPLYFIAQVEDISQRKQMAEEIIRAKEKAEESDRLKLALLTNMSHELRTPMNGILGFTELITRSGAPNEVKDMAQMVATSGKRLMQSIDSIMLLAQLQSSTNTIRLTPASVNLSEELTFVAKSMEDNAFQKGLDYIINIPENIISIAEVKLIRMAFSVVIENAIKYTQNGFVKISALSDNNVVKVVIEDTGIGIPEKYIDKIFEEFRQVSEGYDRNYEGIGIGLSIAKRIVELFKGSITVKSIQNSGSIFTITLPISDTSDIAVPLTAELPEMTTAKPCLAERKDTRILVVEDNLINTKLLVHHLSNYCDIIDCASTGEDALDLTKSNVYDAILMDINLGSGIDGLEATQRIRQMEGYQTTPIIAVTGYTMIGDKDRLISGGCSHYIGKPFSRENIISILKEVLPLNDYS